MTTFYNQAILTYNNQTKTSNIVSGIIADIISVSKKANKTSYTHGDEITYTIAIVNSGSSDLNGLTLTDTLGRYVSNSFSAYPMTYIPNTIFYYLNGILQPTPTVTSEPTLTVTGISVPAGKSTLIQYTVRINNCAPLGIDRTIVNTVTVSGTDIAAVTDSETVSAKENAELEIIKSLHPSTVVENDTLTYTFVISNYGPSEITTADSVIITDTFSPVLGNLSVSLNGTPLIEGTDYNYDDFTGLFRTVNNIISVPAATYSQDIETGVWSVTPGTSTLVISGTVDM